MRKEEFKQFIDACLNDSDNALRIGSVVLTEGGVIYDYKMSEMGFQFTGDDREERILNKMWGYAQKNGEFVFNEEKTYKV